MDIILAVLQWLGWNLLIFLLLILCIVLLVLFVPVRYEAEGEFKESQWVKGRVHWLLHLFGVRVVYEDELVFIEIKILWIQKNFTFELNQEKEETPKEKPQKEKKQNSGEKQSMISKIRGILHRIKELYPKIKKIITDDRNKAAVSHIKDELIYIVKLFLPENSKIDGIFSTGSPDTTGQAYGIIACLPMMYENDWKLLPDFAGEEAYFHGSFRGEGKIYIFKLLGSILRIVFDKNCQRMYTMINKFLKLLKKKSSQEEK